MMLLIMQFFSIPITSSHLDPTIHLSTLVLDTLIYDIPFGLELKIHTHPNQWVKQEYFNIYVPGQETGKVLNSHN